MDFHSFFINKSYHGFWWERDVGYNGQVKEWESENKKGAQDR